MIKLIECPVCDNEDWKSLDYLRDRDYWIDKDYIFDEQIGFKICKTCGFVTYDYVEEEILKERYRRARPVMQYANILTCNRKNEYHKKFLTLDLIKKLESVYDVGCAQGSFLKMMRDNGVKEVSGCEWSKAFRDYAIYEYGLNVTEDVEIENRQDMICYYHVFEHVQYPSDELQKVNERLKDDGYLYIAVPEYMNYLDEPSGMVCENFEKLYQLDHVNVFTKTSLKNILSRNGFKIIKEDDKIYGYTVLCQKALIEACVKEDHDELEGILKKQKEAFEHLNKNEFSKAIEVFPAFPEAYVAACIQPNMLKDFGKQKEMLEKGLSVCPGSAKIKMQLARLYFQWDDSNPQKTYYSNNIRKAEEILNAITEEKPGIEDSYYLLALIEAKYKKNYQKAREYLGRVLEINPTKFTECNQLIGWIWKERGQNEGKVNESETRL